MLQNTMLNILPLLYNSILFYTVLTFYTTQFNGSKVLILINIDYILICIRVTCAYFTVFSTSLNLAVV